MKDLILISHIIQTLFPTLMFFLIVAGLEDRSLNGTGPLIEKNKQSEATEGQKYPYLTSTFDD